MKVGATFGYWTVVDVPAPTKKYEYRATCMCRCGTVRSVSRGSLVSGGTLSCGCLVGERNKERATHGHSGSEEYKIWTGLLTRCYNSSHESYLNYGAKGVEVCDSWRNSFAAFFADMGPRPSPLHSVDRVKNHLGYSPDNCKWSTPVAQANNKTNNITLIIGGEADTLPNWCRRYDRSYITIYQRLFKFGWSPEKALTTPTKTGFIKS